jgi:hypothetical protein
VALPVNILTCIYVCCSKHVTNNTLQAVDTVSQLRSSVLVELTVVDLNERPTCTISSTNLDIQVGAAVDTQIIEFACSDPDVKKEYRTLSYDISGSDGKS